MFQYPKRDRVRCSGLVSQTLTALWFPSVVRLSPTAATSLQIPGIGIRRQHPGPTPPQLSLASSETQNGSGETCGSQTDIPVACRPGWLFYDLVFSSYSFLSRLVALRALMILTDSPCAVKHTTSRRLDEWPIMISRCSSTE